MTAPLSNPRKYVPVVDRSWCFIHSAWEPIYEDNFRICAECGHSFWTPRALVLRHNEMIADFWFSFHEEGEPRPAKVDDADTILSCPICGHDW